MAVLAAGGGPDRLAEGARRPHVPACLPATGHALAEGSAAQRESCSPGLRWYSVVLPEESLASRDERGIDFHLPLPPNRFSPRKSSTTVDSAVFPSQPPCPPSTRVLTAVCQNKPSTVRGPRVSSRGSKLASRYFSVAEGSSTLTGGVFHRAVFVGVLRLFRG